MTRDVKSTIEYVEQMLGELRLMAMRNEFVDLAYMISVAELEAKNLRRDLPEMLGIPAGRVEQGTMSN